MVAGLLFYLTQLYVLKQAENKIEDLLLAHNGIHQYVQQIMHPAFYKYKKEGKMQEDFYAPELLSSSFIVRNQHYLYNKERVASGLPEVYYKLAANNPRNPVNKADAMEEKLIQMFNEQKDVKKHREIIQVDDKKYLYVALPFLANEQRCLICHGEREKAPKQLQEIYEGQGGFNERIGDIRAIISIRAPLDREYSNTYIIFSALFAAVLAIISLFLFNSRLKNLVQKRTLSLEQEIVERKRVEDSLTTVNTELNSKNKELEQILYVASHDLRSPLVNVQGFSMELANDFHDIFVSLDGDDVPKGLKAKLEQKLRDDIPLALGFISKSIDKMDSLLAGLLKISRLGRAAISITSLDMNRLVAEAIGNLEFQLSEKEISVQVETLPNCLGDALQVGQVLTNLIGNAIKFTKADKQGTIRITGVEQGKFVVYCIEDNGIGIEKAYQEKIFEIFHQLRPDSEGQGLGLNIVKKIIERLGGAIWVDSEPNNFCKFYISLPKG
jgi:signal transduction histidine kinase